MQSKTWSRLSKSMFACAVGACSAPFLLMLLLCIWHLIAHWPELDSIGSKLYLNFLFAVSVVPHLFLILFVIGLPLQSSMQKGGFTHYPLHAFFGSLLGILPVFFGAWENSIYLMFGALGFFSVSIAWLIRRPDLDDKPEQQNT